MRPILTLVDKSAKTVTINAAGMFGSNNMTFPLTHEKFMECFDAWQNGAMVQDAFPMFSAEQREFLITGMSIKQQKEIFGTDSNPEEN